MYAKFDFGGSFMLQTGIAALSQTVADLSIGERAVSAAKVILTGFIVVFSMLFLLIVIIKVYSAVIAGVQNASDRRMRKKEKVMEPITNGSIASSKLVYVTPPTVDEGIPEEVVAVIAAAVAASASPGVTTHIKSIKKSNGGRSAWANAGVLDNTRPF